MTNIKLLKSNYEEDANALLIESQAMGFETVVVVGIKDGMSYIRRSRLVSTTQLLGALEEAKWHILSEQTD